MYYFCHVIWNILKLVLFRTFKFFSFFKKLTKRSSIPLLMFCLSILTVDLCCFSIINIIMQLSPILTIILLFMNDVSRTVIIICKMLSKNDVFHGRFPFLTKWETPKSRCRNITGNYHDVTDEVYKSSCELQCGFKRLFWPRYFVKSGFKRLFWPRYFAFLR